jgi:hypothetical protein
VLKVDGMVFCNQCETASARTERGWRAYLATGANGEPTVAVVCPICAEACFGEDEPQALD